MPIDGCFIHHLVNELNNELMGGKINKIYQPSFLELAIQVRTKNTGQKQLYLSSSLDQPRIFLTDMKFSNLDNPLNFCMVLRKYIDRGIIKDISQYRNDRIINISIENANELGDDLNYHLIFELMGRNSNIILTNSQYLIVDAIRKVVPESELERTILPKAQYLFPDQSNTINPFEVEKISSFSYNQLQGCSKILLNEMKEQEITNPHEFLTKQLIPTLYLSDTRNDIYFLDLTTISYKTKESFLTLSSLLEKEKNLSKQINSYQISELMKQVKKIITSKHTKVNNLQKDLDDARKNIIYTNLGILLQSNLYMVKSGLKSITVNNFLNENEEIEILLDPLLTPSENLKKIFSKGKKANTALVKVNEQLMFVNAEIKYLNLIYDQLSFASLSDYEEIKLELVNAGYLKKQNDKGKNKKVKLNLQKINIENTVITIGKNNLQNEYLIHKVARNNDLWFHVKDAPGAHIVISAPNNAEDFQPSENLIRLASNIAGLLSKMSHSSSVAVDYTKIKYLKKIPGERGYNVTYTNQKTIYIDPDQELVKKYKL